MSQLQVTKPNDPLASLRIDRTVPNRRPTRWVSKVAVGCLLMAVAAGAMYGWMSYGQLLLRPEVRVATVEVRVPGTADSVLQAQGYLKSRQQAAIGAKVAGRIDKLFVKEGDRVDVEKSDLLAELEHGDMDALLAATRAALDGMGALEEAMEADLKKAELELREAEITYAQDESDFLRADGLYRKSGTSRSDWERAESKMGASRNRRDSLKAAVQAADARLRETQAKKLESEKRIQEIVEQRENYFVRAKFSGTVISKEAEVGESIMPGGMGAASGRGSVVTMANLLEMEVETDVKEDYLNRVRPRQEVSVAVDAVPDRRFKGTVRTIIPMGDRSRGTVKVKVDLDAAEVEQVNGGEMPMLFPEMAATVYFMSEGKAATTGQIEPQVFVSSDALKKDDSVTFVWQVVEQKVKRVIVDTVDGRDGRALVQRGLKGGEQVVIDASADLKENMLVRVAP